MIDPDVRNAIYQLHLAGMPLQEIGRQFQVSRNTVRAIVRQQGAMPQTVRKDKIHVDPELLRRLYRQCDGWLQRIHEKLVEEEKIQVSYPTLTRLVRELGLGKPSQARCDHVPDEPGAGDAARHHAVPGEAGGPADAGHRQPAVPAVLEAAVPEVLPRLQPLRHEVLPARGVDVLGLRGPAVRHRQHQPGAAAGQRQAGGDRAGNGRLRPALRLPVPLSCDSPSQPKSRARRRSFWTVETNFLPGRSFQSLEDLNQQALEWATVRMEHRPAEQDGLDPRQGLRARTPLSDQAAGPTPRAVLAAGARHGRVRIRCLRGELLLGPGDQAGRRQGAAIRGPLEDLSAADLRGRVPAAGRRGQERPFQPRGTASAAVSAQASQARFPARGTAAARPWARRWRPTWITPSRRPASSGIASCENCSP